MKKFCKENKYGLIAMGVSIVIGCMFDTFSGGITCGIIISTGIQIDSKVNKK